MNEVSNYNEFVVVLKPNGSVGDIHIQEQVGNYFRIKEMTHEDVIVRVDQGEEINLDKNFFFGPGKEFGQLYFLNKSNLECRIVFLIGAGPIGSDQISFGDAKINVRAGVEFKDAAHISIPSGGNVEVLPANVNRNEWTVQLDPSSSLSFVLAGNNPSANRGHWVTPNASVTKNGQNAIRVYNPGPSAALVSVSETE